MAIFGKITIQITITTGPWNKIEISWQYCRLKLWKSVCVRVRTSVCYSQPRCGWDAQQRWVLWQKPDDHLQKHSIHTCTWGGRSQRSAKANWWCGNRKETCREAGCSTWWTRRRTQKDRNIQISGSVFPWNLIKLNLNLNQAVYKGILNSRSKFIIQGI